MRSSLNDGRAWHADRRLLTIVVAAAVGAAVAVLWLEPRRRRRESVPALNRHPERLEQMLDATDDA